MFGSSKVLRKKKILGYVWFIKSAKEINKKNKVKMIFLHLIVIWKI